MAGLSALVSKADTNALAPSPAAISAASLPATMRDSGTHTNKTRYLTLNECIKIALEHNLDIKIQEFNPRINQFALNGSYGTYEPDFTFNGSKSYTDNPPSGGAINPATGLAYPSSISEVDNYAPGITGSLPTGLKYDLFSQLNRNSILNTPANSGGYYLPPTWSSDAGISLDQPLLQNFWIDSTRLNIRLNKITLKTSEAGLRLQIMTTITAVQAAYYNLLYDIGNVEANTTAYQLAEQLVAENHKRVEVGSLSPLDEKQSASQAAANLAAVQAAQHVEDVQENTLKTLLSENYTEWVDTSIIPAEELEANPRPLDLQESWRRAVTQRPDLLEAKLKVESQNVTLKYDYNQRFPALDLKGSYGRNANRGGLYENLGDIRDGDHSFYSYGIAANVPLGGNVNARNKYRADKETLQQLLIQLKQAEQNILVAVDNDVSQVRSTLQQVYATRDARIYAQDALDAEKTKLAQGKSTSFIVLQLISNLTTARVNEIQALANYNIALSQLDFDEGNTIDANHIDLSVK